MFLELGNRQRIDEPTAEQIGDALRNLPADAPFVVLNADDEHFIQATPAGGLMRVEWRQESQQRVMLVPIEQAERSFLAFRKWDEPGLKSFPWRRLSLSNDPYHWLPAAVLGAALAAIIAWRLLVWAEGLG